MAKRNNHVLVYFIPQGGNPKFSGGNKPPAKLVGGIGGTLARLGHSDSRYDPRGALHALNMLFATMVGEN